MEGRKTRSPWTDRACAIGNLRKFGAPSAKFPQIANLQWSVCLHVSQSGNTFRDSFRSIWDYIPRFLSLNLGLHSEVLAQSGNTFRGSSLLQGARAGFASMGAQTLFDLCLHPPFCAQHPGICAPTWPPLDDGHCSEDGFLGSLCSSSKHYCDVLWLRNQ